MSISPETLLKTDSVLVRKMALAPKEVKPLHYHSQVVEQIVCLAGEISVSIQFDEEIRLLPGQCILIEPKLRHQVRNPLDASSLYLLTQSGGDYDFCSVAA